MASLPSTGFSSFLSRDVKAATDKVQWGSAAPTAYSLEVGMGTPANAV